MSAYSYAGDRPSNQTDPLGLYTAKLDSVHIFALTDPKGFPGRCKNAAGGCTLDYLALLHCDCVCASDGMFKASCMLNISANIYIYAGDHFLDHFHPQFDTSVKNYVSALHHEEYVHLLAAARDRHVRRLINPLENRTYQSRAECEAAWPPKVGPVIRAYARALAKTQLGENLGFVH